jgi:hypothetical protein
MSNVIQWDDLALRLKQFRQRITENGLLGDGAELAALTEFQTFTSEFAVRVRAFARRFDAVDRQIDDVEDPDIRASLKLQMRLNRREVILAVLEFSKETKTNLARCVEANGT